MFPRCSGCSLRHGPLIAEIGEEVVGTPTKSRTTAFILSWLLGCYGIDRFYLGYTGLGIAKLCTFGGCGIWAIIDFVLTGMGSMKDAEGNSLLKS